MVFSNVTSDNGMEAISSRLRLVADRIDCVASLISCGVRSHWMGGTDDEVDALVARALSTSLGSQVPQMEPKSKDPEELLLTTLSFCRMEVENALKQQGQRGLLLEVVVLPMLRISPVTVIPEVLQVREAPMLSPR